jgi:hypothetical protein
MCRADLTEIFDQAKIPSATPKGFATIEVCINTQCGLRGKEVLDSQWDQQGEIDVVNSDSSKCQSCLQPRSISKLRFRKCHVQLVMRMESASGEKTWTTTDEFCAGVKDIRLNPSDQILVLRARTTSSPKLKQPPRRVDMEPRVTTAVTEEHVFVDDVWLEQFHALCHSLPPQTLPQIKETLTPIVSAQDKILLRRRTQEWKDRLKRPSGGGFILNLSQGPTMQVKELFFPEDAEDSLEIIYWYTLETPPVYQKVSMILNNPALRTGSNGQVAAAMPFAKRLMEACQQVVTLQPDLRFGQDGQNCAWRGVAYRYSEMQWKKFQPGHHVTWYTVKSLSSSPDAVEKLMGNAPHVTIFEVVNCTGVTIKPFSQYEDEDEILLMPGSRFEVEDAIRSTKPGDPSVWNKADYVTLRMVA